VKGWWFVAPALVEACQLARLNVVARRAERRDTRPLHPDQCVELLGAMALSPTPSA